VLVAQTINTNININPTASMLTKVLSTYSDVLDEMNLSEHLKREVSARPDQSWDESIASLSNHVYEQTTLGKEDIGFVSDVLEVLSGTAAFHFETLQYVLDPDVNVRVRIEHPTTDASQYADRWVELTGEALMESIRKHHDEHQSNMQLLNLVDPESCWEDVLEQTVPIHANVRSLQDLKQHFEELQQEANTNEGASLIDCIGAYQTTVEMRNSDRFAPHAPMYDQILSGTLSLVMGGLGGRLQEVGFLSRLGNAARTMKAGVASMGGRAQRARTSVAKAAKRAHAYAAKSKAGGIMKKMVKSLRTRGAKGKAQMHAHMEAMGRRAKNARARGKTLGKHMRSQRERLQTSWKRIKKPTNAGTPPQQRAKTDELLASLRVKNDMMKETLLASELEEKERLRAENDQKAVEAKLEEERLRAENDMMKEKLLASKLKEEERLRAENDQKAVEAKLEEERLRAENDMMLEEERLRAEKAKQHAIATRKTLVTAD